MEIPYNGRAIVEDNFDSVKIIVPAKKNYFTMVFLLVWLCGWVFGETTALSGILNSGHNGPQLFLIVWLIGWTVGGIFALKTALWNLSGKEIIEVGKGSLVIKKQGDWFSKPTAYDLNACKSFRVQDDSIYNNRNRMGRFRGFNDKNDIGTIVFDYGMKTIRFGEAVDEAEGKYLLDFLLNKKILTEKNLV